MASIQKVAKGYRAQIKLILPNRDSPLRESKVFTTRREASEWVAQRERELRQGAVEDPRLSYTLRKALRRYYDEVSPLKRGERWEQIRLAAFENYLLPLEVPLIHITPQHIADFRDSRKQSIGDASVRREISLLSSVFDTARLEWGWAETNPCKNIRKPPHSKHRERVISPVEARMMLRQMGYSPLSAIRSVSQAVAVCMLVALRTGMRAGELCNLEWTRVYDKHVVLPLTKNGTTRNVPLSTKAIRLITKMHGWDEKLVFGIKTASLDALFRKYRQRAELEGFTFHDTRHTAATMLSKKVDVLTLCKIFGWKDPRYALVYYNPSVSTIADMLG